MQNPVMEFIKDDRLFSKEKALALLEEHRKKVLAEKAKEYTIEGNNDRLENFKYMKRMISQLGYDKLDVSDIIIILMTKHTASIEMLDVQDDYTQDILLEKCGDALNYYDLLRMAIDSKEHSWRKLGPGLLVIDMRVKNSFIYLAKKLYDKGAWHV